MDNQIDNIPIMFAKAMKTLKRLEGRALEEYDLGALYAPFIRVLYAHKEGITLKELGEILMVDKAHISRVIVALEGMGYVERFRADESSPRSRVKLSASGLALGKDYTEKMRKFKARLLSTIEPEELAALAATLQKLAAAVEEIED